MTAAQTSSIKLALLTSRACAG